MIHGVINLLAMAHGIKGMKMIHGGLFAVTELLMFLEFLWYLGCLMMVWTHGTQRSRTKETGPSTWKLQCK